MLRSSEFPYHKQVKAFTNILNRLNAPYAGKMLNYDTHEYMVTYNGDAPAFSFCLLQLNKTFSREMNLTDFLTTQDQRHLKPISSEQIYITILEVFEESIRKHYRAETREEMKKIKNTIY